MPLTYAEPLLMRTSACTKRACHLQQYSKVVAAYINLQTICSLMVSITQMPRAHSDVVAYQNVKEPRYIIAMSMFMLNVLNYITVSRAL